MIGKATTKLIIVCDDKTKEYGNYLRQLISVKDDIDGKIVGVEDGTVDAVVWTEKEYQDQEKTISSSEHILFIGNNKTSQSEIKNMPSKFEKYGMKYGWLGKRGMMQVEDTLLNKKDYGDFIDFCSTYKQYFNRLAYTEREKFESKKVSSLEYKEDSNKVEVVETNEVPVQNQNKFVRFLGDAKNIIINNVLEPAGEFVEKSAVGLAEDFNAQLAHGKIKDQQYRVLTVILYLDGLKEFLEG